MKNDSGVSLMKFVYQAYHSDITNEDLIKDLQRIRDKLGNKSLSMAEYDKNGQYNSSTISRRFGTWNDALRTAGIDLRNEFWEEIDLFNNLETVWIAKGKQPTRRDMDEYPQSQISSGAYLRRFGKWSAALASFVEYVNNTEEEANGYQEGSSQKSIHKTKRDVNHRLRFLVLARDNFSCCKCGASPAKDGGITVLHVDHIVPWSKGGETTLDNLQTLCSKCNLGKSNTICN